MSVRSLVANLDVMVVVILLGSDAVPLHADHLSAPFDSFSFTSAPVKAFSLVSYDWFNGLLPWTASIAEFCVQVPCCNVHFINDNVFQINTSQGMTGFKQDCCPEALPRKLSLCTWTLLPEFPEVLIVPDTLQDIRSDPDLANPCRYALFPLAVHKYCHNSLPQLHGKGKAAYTSTKCHHP